MARTAPATTRRPAAPPATEMTVYEELWEAVAAADPNFAGPSENEDDQDYYKRTVRAVAAIPIDDWNNLSAAAQQWYDDAAGAMESNQEIAPLPGFAEPADEEGEEAVEEEPAAAVEEEPEAEPEPEVSPARQSARDRMIAINEKRKAEKLATAQTAAPRKIAAPPAATRRNAAPVAPPRKAPAAPAAPARRGAPPPARTAAAPPRKAAAPAPRKAAAPRAEAGPSNMELIRQLIVENQDITVDEIIQYMNENHNFDAKQSTVTGVLTTTRATINTIKELNHWVD